MIQVLCASLGDRQPKGLEHIPGDYEITYCAKRPWAAAANKLLDHAAKTGDNVLFLDDDIELTPSAFAFLKGREPVADVIGFTLLYRDGNVQSAGQVYVPSQDSVQMQPLATLYEIMTPRFVAHVTASCLWLSSKIVQSSVRFPVWEGQHHEDAAYTVEAWRNGFTVAYVPGIVWHDVSREAGAGATKAHIEGFQADRMKNWARLNAWYREIGLTQLCIDGVVPLGSKEVR